MEHDAAKELVDMVGLDNVHEEHCADMAYAFNSNKTTEENNIDGGLIWEEIMKMRGDLNEHNKVFNVQERIDGLVSIGQMTDLNRTVIELTEDLLEEGFDGDDIALYLKKNIADAIIVIEDRHKG